MELTLLPLTAILILLSGVTAPRYVAAEQLSAVAFVRFWFTLETEEASALESSQNRPGRSPSCSRARAHTSRMAASKLCQRAQFALRAFARPFLRTRFGVSSGAYCSMAPPAAA